MDHVLREKKQPLYLQIYKKIRDNIIAGDYPHGTKLPSKRSLSDQMGVSTITVEHAYTLLCEEGYVEAKERCGYLVIFRKDDGFAIPSEISHKHLTPILNFHHSKPDIASGPNGKPYYESADFIVNKHHSIPSIVSGPNGKPYYDSLKDLHEEDSYSDLPVTVFSKTVRKVMTEYRDILLNKSPGPGIFQLREAILHYLSRNRGIHVRIEQIIIGAGSEYLYRLITEILGRNLIYGIESPSYKKIEQVYKAAGVAYDHLPLTHSGIDSNALNTTNAEVLHTTPYRSYPSGITATATKRFEYIHWSGKGKRYIIEDDYESEFSISAKPIETLFASSPYDNVIYLNTFSKTISSSIRAGYMVLPKHLTHRYHETLGFYSCTVPTFMQYVLTELLNSGDFERHINRIRRKSNSSAHDQSPC